VGSGARPTTRERRGGRFRPPAPLHAPALDAAEGPFGVDHAGGGPGQHHLAVDQLVELAGERGDADELRRLAAGGSSDAVDQLVELASERGDVAELRRLAAAGSRDAADVLTELTESQDEDSR
jgi:hypothetical protein